LNYVDRSVKYMYVTRPANTLNSPLCLLQKLKKWLCAGTHALESNANPNPNPNYNPNLTLNPNPNCTTNRNLMLTLNKLCTV